MRAAVDTETGVLLAKAVIELVQLGKPFTRESLQAALLEGDTGTIGAYLKRIKRDYSLDTLNLLDSEGKVILRIAEEKRPAGDRLEDPLVLKALGGELASGSTIFSREEFQKEDPELARRADIKVIPTVKSSAR